MKKLEGRWGREFNREIQIISSKSSLERALICASFADKGTKITFRGQLSDDVRATISSLKSMGAIIEEGIGAIEVRPINNMRLKKIEKGEILPMLNAKESAATARFFMGIFETFGQKANIVGEPVLMERLKKVSFPHIHRYFVNLPDGEKLPALGITELSNTSQYISGLLMGIGIRDVQQAVIFPALQKSIYYIRMTVKVMEDFGIVIGDLGLNEAESRPPYSVIGTGVAMGGYISPGVYEASGDWSAAANFLVAGAMAGDVRVRGLDIDNLQGGEDLLEILRKFGAKVDVVCCQEIPKKKFEVRVRRMTLEAPGAVDCSNIPDMVMAIAALAAVSRGETKITNIRSLNFKETNRIKKIAEVINALGGNAEYGMDYIVINGVDNLKGGSVNADNDHRIAMMASIMSYASEGDIELTGEECVNKSYPTYWEDFEG